MSIYTRCLELCTVTSDQSRPVAGVSVSAAYAPSRLVSELSKQIKNRRCTNEVICQLGNLPVAGLLGWAAFGGPGWEEVRVNGGRWILVHRVTISLRLNDPVRPDGVGKVSSFARIIERIYLVPLLKHLCVCV